MSAVASTLSTAAETEVERSDAPTVQPRDPYLTALYPSAGLDWTPSADAEGPLERLIHEWVRRACRHSRVRRIDRRVWVADVVGLDGAWADGPSPEAAEAALPGVVEEWVRMKLADGDSDLPAMHGTRLVVEG